MTTAVEKPVPSRYGDTELGGRHTAPPRRGEPMSDAIVQEVGQCYTGLALEANVRAERRSCVLVRPKLRLEFLEGLVARPPRRGRQFVAACRC